MYLNKVFLIGNVGRDPEVRNVNGVTVASFSLATTERYKDRNGEVKEITDWINVVAWRNSAEFIQKYITKGMSVLIEGRIKTRSWTTDNGDKRSATDVMVDHIQPTQKRERQEDNSNQNGREPQQSQGSDIPPQFQDGEPSEDQPF